MIFIFPLCGWPLGSQTRSPVANMLCIFCELLLGCLGLRLANTARFIDMESRSLRNKNGSRERNVIKTSEYDSINAD